MTHNHQTEQSSTRSTALHRIKIIEGHLKAIEKMLETGAYCVDIIHQSMAVQKALKRLDMAIMENHLKTCVVDQIKADEIEKSVSELMRLYEMK